MTLLQLVLLIAIASPPAVAIWVARGASRPLVRHHGVTSAIGSCQIGPGFGAELLDLDAELRAVADSLEEHAKSRFVMIELALASDLRIRASWDAMWMVLRSVLNAGIQATPGGNVLVSASMIGSEIAINVLDDGATVDQRLRESMIREAQGLVALQGGALVVEARPGRGTLVTIRLPVSRASGFETTPAIVEPTLSREVA